MSRLSLLSAILREVDINLLYKIYCHGRIMDEPLRMLLTFFDLRENKMVSRNMEYSIFISQIQSQFNVFIKKNLEIKFR